jgi:putative DeoR family transcriptional regulator (stage III sporulation protein D)
MYEDYYSYYDEEIASRSYTAIENRCIEEAQWIIDNKCSIRQCAREFMISKSQLHRDVTERLMDLNDDLFVQVRTILRKHKRSRW